MTIKFDPFSGKLVQVPQATDGGGETVTWAVATGGTVTEYNDGTDDWRLHVFNSSDNITITSAGKAEVFVVAGGGGGGLPATEGFGGSGAGGGGVYYSTVDLTIGTTAITIGAGGATGVPGFSNEPNRNGIRGNNSTAFGITALGGGGARGVTTSYNLANMDGGSGAGMLVPAFEQRAGSGFSYQGHDGGLGVQTDAISRAVGGGGGAGGPGGDGIVSTASGDAGPGFDASVFFNGTMWLGCGAAGTEGSVAVRGTAATGGSDAGEAGAVNTGNAGGSGVGNTIMPAPGGSGVVAIRYKI